MVLGQYGAVLVGTWWYWVSITWYCLVLSGTGLIKGFYASIYWKKLMVTSTDRPTNRPTDQQGEYRAICLFRKLENRKKAEICNFLISWACKLPISIINRYFLSFIYFWYFSGTIVDGWPPPTGTQFWSVMEMRWSSRTTAKIASRF